MKYSNPLKLLFLTTIGMTTFQTVSHAATPSPIQNGYGDFVFSLKGAIKPTLDPKACEDAYRAISNHTIQHYADQDASSRALDRKVQDTYSDLKKSLEEALHKDIELTFIPKTLYELMYLNRYTEQNILDDFKSKGLTAIDTLKAEDRLDGDSKNNLQDHDAAKLTCQMLDVATEYLRASGIQPDATHGLSKEEIQKLLNDQLDRLESSFHASTSKSVSLKPDIALLFERMFGDTGISYVRAKSIMHNAVAAEIDPQSIGSFLVYRPNSHTTPDELVLNRFPASFMTSLFSGMHDRFGNTTAIYFMHPKAEGYVFRVPLSRMIGKNRKLCPLHISLGNTVRQLAATNQPSHNWLKGPQKLFREIAEMERADADSHFKDPGHLWHYIGISKEFMPTIKTMQAEFNNYYAHRIVLAPMTN